MSCKYGTYKEAVEVAEKYVKGTDLTYVIV